jgi:hypothetical protein
VKKTIAPPRRLAAPAALTAVQLARADGGLGGATKPSFTPPHPGPPTAIRYEEGRRFDVRRRKHVPTMKYEEVTGAPKPIPESKKDQPGFGLFD